MALGLLSCIIRHSSLCNYLDKVCDDLVWMLLFCRFACRVVHRHHSRTKRNSWENADVVCDSLAVQSLHIHHWYKRKLWTNSLRSHALDSHMFDEGCKLWISYAVCSVIATFVKLLWWNVIGPLKLSQLVLSWTNVCFYNCVCF